MRRVTPNPENLNQIIKLANQLPPPELASRSRVQPEPSLFWSLPVNVSYDGDGGLDVDYVALAHQELLGFFADFLDQGFPKKFLA